uniref:Uncharacterized protein n=1 Tax=mine drainage metagenome TaxID=410659 RepID=E6QBP2_9ZZZZ
MKCWDASPPGSSTRSPGSIGWFTIFHPSRRPPSSGNNLKPTPSEREQREARLRAQMEAKKAKRQGRKGRGV